MQTIGQALKYAREEKRLTLEKVFQATRIRIPYLEALEADDLSAMPSPVQARGYLRNYAEYLGLNLDQLLEDMRAQARPADELITPLDDVPPPQAIPAPEPTSPQEPTPLPTPKPTRRKKTDSPPDPSAPEKPVRRTRKKVEPQPEPVLESAPKPTPEPQPEPPTDPQSEITPESQVEIIAEPQSEPTLEPQQPIEEQPLPEPETDSNDRNWKTWLNRLSSLVSIRISRPSAESETDSESQTEQPEQESVVEETNLTSDQIFKEIGIELSKRRELLSLHLEEVERNTHVKAHYVEALERGAMDQLPSTVQTRGMLSNYASFLDLNVDEILLRYADALQARHREKNPQRSVRDPKQPIVASIPPMRSFIAGDLIFGVGSAILLAGFIIWAISFVLNIQNTTEVQPTIPPISDVLLATADPSLFTPTSTLAPVEDFGPTVTIVIPTQNANVSVQVNLVAVERTYMRVIVDGEEAFNGRVTPGVAYPFEAENQVEVLVGSGAAIRIVYNGRDLGLLGGFGQVVSNIYLADSIITPTALPTQIPTSTFTPTATVPPTATPVPSRTPAATSTP